MLGRDRGARAVGLENVIQTSKQLIRVFILLCRQLVDSERDPFQITQAL